MSAPTYSEETVLRAIEAMRTAAFSKAMESREAINRNGHAEVVAEKDFIARGIGELDVRAILSSIVGSGPIDSAEVAAFESEAKRLGFSVSRRDNNELFYPMTKRIWQLWQAAVRWKSGEAVPPDLANLKLVSWSDIENYGHKFCDGFNAGVQACIDQKEKP